MSRSERATVLRINSVGAVGAQVAPGRVVFEHRAEDHEQRAHAGGERANTRVGQAASTDGRGYRARDAGGAQSASIPKSARSTISTTCAIPILPPFPSFRHSCAPSAIPAPPPPFLRPLRHSCAPSVIPAEAGIHATAQPCDEPPSAIPILPSFLRPLRPLRHSCAPSVIPAEAGIHATAQPCDEPPSAIPILHPPFPSAIPAPPPSFLRPLRHSCGGRNPRDRPTVRRASIRHSHPSAIPAPPPSSAIPILPPFLRPLRHSCAPSVIPAEAGIHATAQPCDEPPSAIPILPPFLRPLRHSCAPSVIPAEAGIHATAQPCDEPPSARRPTRAPSAPRVIGRRRTLGVPLTPQIAWIPASAGMTDRRV